MRSVPGVRSAAVRRVSTAVVLAIFFALQLAPGVALARGGSAHGGTSLTATKTTTGHLIRTFPWTLSKSASVSSLTLSNGESEAITYTVGATKGAGVLSAIFDGQICVKNTGNVATVGLSITDAVTKPPSKQVLGFAVVSVAAHPILAPDETFCYPYSVVVPAPAAPGATYKDTATVTIVNHSGPGGGPTPSTANVLPTTVEVTNNDTILVADTNGSSFLFSATGTQTYQKTFTCDADAGDLLNTVSAAIDPAPAPQTVTVTVTCLDPDVSVTKTVDLDAATVGDTIVYTVTVVNGGPGTAHGVSLLDGLPAGISWTIDDTTNFALAGGTLTLNGEPLAALAAGASLTVHVSGTIDNQVCPSTMVNTATVAADNEPAAQNGNNSASATTAVSCPPPPISPPISPPVSPPVCPPVSPPVSGPISPPVSGPIGDTTAFRMAATDPCGCPPVSPPAGDTTLFGFLQVTDSCECPPVSPPVSEPISPPVSEPISPPVSEPISPPVSPPEPPPCPGGGDTTIASYLGTGTAALVEAALAAVLLIAFAAGAVAAARAQLGRRRMEGAR